MLIARGQTIGGVDAVELREVLRKFLNCEFSPGGFARRLGDGSTGSDELFEMLVREGLIERGAAAGATWLYIEPDESLHDAELWHITVAGSALAKARIGKPIRRHEAKRLLDGVVTRAGDVNRDPGQLFHIETIELFGSLTRPDAEYVGDVDLRILISHRFQGDDLIRELERREPGSVIDALMATTRKLHRLLTGGSHRIDLQLDETVTRPLPEGANPIVIYRRPDDTTAAQT